MQARSWRQELIRIAKCERPEITPEMARLAMEHIDELEKEMGNAYRLLKIANSDNRYWIEKRDSFCESIEVFI